MGCASSVARAPHRVYVQCGEGEAPPAALDGPHPALDTDDVDAALHADAIFDEYVTPDDDPSSLRAHDEFEAYADRWSNAKSDGDAAEEPSDFGRNVTITMRVMAARVKNGIDSDPYQFVPGNELASTVDACVRRTNKWLDENEATCSRALDTPMSCATLFPAYPSLHAFSYTTAQRSGGNYDYDDDDADGGFDVADDAAGYDDSVAAFRPRMAQPNAASSTRPFSAIPIVTDSNHDDDSSPVNSGLGSPMRGATGAGRPPIPPPPTTTTAMTGGGAAHHSFARSTSSNFSSSNGGRIAPAPPYGMPRLSKAVLFAYQRRLASVTAAAAGGGHGSPRVGTPTL